MLSVVDLPHFRDRRGRAGTPSFGAASSFSYLDSRKTIMPATIPKETILAIFRETGALLEGHFQLTSGLHSPQYFQCARVLQYPEYLHRFAGELASLYKDSALDAVISPALGGIVVGTEVGRILNVRTMFSERKNGVMELRRGFELRKGERILVVEDVVTTGGSVFEVINLVRAADAVPAGVGFIVDRSKGALDFHTEQHALLRMDAVTYPPEACPLCRNGIPIVKPGSRKDR